ncbi:uncharacterized protein LOC120140024 [Hibiscus syriacus]|uniref:uncharacterized protein LOC120140024 n=1 Tax=Hibiscus syriacus TaxID=106335 RepID=UPI001921983F|nr:uncharacterized protein LOC120140024 [Hibiscus syriacus]
MDVFCLLETRVKAEKSINILGRKFDNWNVCINYDFAINDMIWILWRKGIEFSVCHVFEQNITIKSLHLGNPIVIIIVYGSNDDRVRKFLWQQLHDLDRTYGQLPWILGGDFNSNKQQNSYLVKKLDRVLVNQNWVNSFSSSHVEFMAPCTSDHYLDLLWLYKKTQHPNFLNVVNQSWQCPSVGNPMQILFTKLKRLKAHLKDLNHTFYSDLSHRVNQKRIELEQNQLKTLRGEAVIEEDLYLQRELKTLEDAEAMFLKQKAKTLDPHLLQDLLQPSLPTNSTTDLIKDVLRDEIKEAFFIQGNDKAPGPDGFTPLFFKKSWPIIGRNIVNNTLLAQELVRGYIRKSISPRCSLKIDLHKAFDSLNWGFITAILKALGLSTTFITWIEICFSTAKYSISFNGSLIGYFKGARGVRQRDPLSPFLFFLSMNVLSILLNLAAAKGTFGYHPKCKRISLTHLSFADDLLIFGKDSVNFVIGVTTVLDLFYEMSGLRLNASKCELFAAGVPFIDLEEIKLITGFKLSSLPV